MAQTPNWSSHGLEATAWDATWLGKHYLPGITTYEIEKERDVDEQKSPEVDGVKQVNKGIVGAKVRIKFRLFNNDDAWQQWCSILREIDPHKPGATKEPYEILNPEPNHLGITQVTILRIKSSSPNCKSGKGYEIECKQWFPAPKPAKSKTTAQKKGTTVLPEIEIRPGVQDLPNFTDNALP